MYLNMYSAIWGTLGPVPPSFRVAHSRCPLLQTLLLGMDRYRSILPSLCPANVDPNVTIHVSVRISLHFKQINVQISLTASSSATVIHPNRHKEASSHLVCRTDKN